MRRQFKGYEEAAASQETRGERKKLEESLPEKCFSDNEEEAEFSDGDVACPDRCQTIKPTCYSSSSEEFQFETLASLKKQQQKGSKHKTVKGCTQ